MAERPPNMAFRTALAGVGLLAILAAAIINARAGQTTVAVMWFVFGLAGALWFARLFFRRRAGDSQQSEHRDSERIRTTHMKHQSLWIALCLLVALGGGPVLVRLFGIPSGVGMIGILCLLVAMGFVLGYAERREKRRS